MDRRVKRRSIGVVTVARSDYGHLTPVLESVAADPALALGLYVAGAHLAPRYGETVREIEKDGWPIAARIPTAVDDDSPRGIAAMTARAVDGFGAALAADRPDILVVLGDRYEMLAAATAALPFALPVAHVHGGEETEGAIDNQIRHAITKLAHLHFASAPLHAERIASMGEAPWRIHAVGAPGLDRFRRLETMSRPALGEALGVPADARWLIVTFHPATLEPGQAVAHVREVLAALQVVDVWAVITYPGADTEGLAVIAELEAFAARAPRSRVVSHLGERAYLSLLRHADAMVGNSSSGIIEAPSFELPVVNVGTRQAGRLRGANVIDVPPERAAIGAALQQALAPAFRAGLRGVANPYGDGHAAARIVEVLRSVALDARLVRKGWAA
jgi:UDP-hydrolysing UDP-N-acetyl-D-glucosamine 2-epimerase